MCEIDNFYSRINSLRDVYGRLQSLNVSAKKSHVSVDAKRLKLFAESYDKIHIPYRSDG